MGGAIYLVVIDMLQLYLSIYIHILTRIHAHIYIYNYYSNYRFILLFLFYNTHLAHYQVENINIVLVCVIQNNKNNFYIFLLFTTLYLLVYQVLGANRYGHHATTQDCWIARIANCQICQIAGQLNHSN